MIIARNKNSIRPFLERCLFLASFHQPSAHLYGQRGSKRKTERLIAELSQPPVYRSAALENKHETG
jgi:hypothetical protein